MIDCEYFFFVYGFLFLIQIFTYYLKIVIGTKCTANKTNSIYLYLFPTCSVSEEFKKYIM